MMSSRSTGGGGGGQDTLNGDGNLFHFILPFFFSNRRTPEEDDDLSEVRADAVPPEVRAWLASTFTRQISSHRKPGEEKPKFRSVAQAIRAGILVERIYRRMSSSSFLQFPVEVARNLKVICTDYLKIYDVIISRSVSHYHSCVPLTFSVLIYLLFLFFIVFWPADRRVDFRCFRSERRLGRFSSALPRHRSPQSLWRHPQI